ncbi:MAG: DUF58 domain-containing protein [Lentisphaeria bacterium]|nr:DUF58 domain-containing protein [Lentisphaeria bacterium]
MALLDKKNNHGTSAGTSLLEPEDIARLETFEFAPRMVAEGLYAGRHRSLTRGSSTEFRDYREYSPGDEIGLLDWRAYARSDRFYIRTFEQETSLDCTIFLDSSASMGFGEKVSKLRYGSFLAAALSYLVVRRGDRISLHLFDEQLRHSLPHGSTRRHLNHIFTRLERNEAGEATHTAAALNRALPAMRHRGAMLVISDFLDDPVSLFEALDPYNHRGFRIYLCHILDPEELDLPRRGMLTFEDLESRVRVRAHTEELRKAYRDAVSQHVEVIRQLARRRKIEYIPARTDASIHAILNALNQT